MVKMQCGIRLVLCHGRCGYGMWHVPCATNSIQFTWLEFLETAKNPARWKVAWRSSGFYFVTGNVIFRFFHSSILQVHSSSTHRNFHFDQKTEQPSHLTLFGSGPFRHPSRALCIYFSSQILHQKTSSPLSNIWLSGCFVFDWATLHLTQINSSG